MVIPKGFPKSVGRVGSRLHGFPCFPHSVISMACFSRGKCRINRCAPISAVCGTRHELFIGTHRFSMSALVICRQLRRINQLPLRKINLPRNRLQIHQELQSLSALYSGTLDLTHERCNIYAEHSLRPTFIRLRRCLRSRNGRCHYQSRTSESPDGHHPG